MILCIVESYFKCGKQRVALLIGICPDNATPAISGINLTGFYRKYAIYSKIISPFQGSLYPIVK